MGDFGVLTFKPSLYQQSSCRKLAKYYGFSDEKMDFIPSDWHRTGINYNIKYRMGRELDAEEESIKSTNC